MYSAVSAFFRLLLILLSLVSPIPSVSCYWDEWDRAGGTYFWPRYADTVEPGFCLPYSSTSAPGYRSIADFSSPLYLRPIRMAIPLEVEVDYFINWIAKILIQEALGYPLMIVDDSAVTHQWRQRLALPNPSVDIIAATGYIGALELSDSLHHYADSLQSNGALTSYGLMEVIDIATIFIPTRYILQYPQLNFLHFTGWTCGVPRFPQAESFTLPYKKPHCDRVQMNVEVLRNDSWAFWDANPDFKLFNWTDPNSHYSCPPDSYSVPNFGTRMGCNDPNYPSIHVPKQCYPNPREQCAVLLAISPILIGNGFTTLIRTFNLSLVVAYANYNAFNQRSSSNGDWPVLMAHSPIARVAREQCDLTQYGGESTDLCNSRLSFPVYDSRCSAQFDGNYDTPWYCAFRNIDRAKIGRADLAGYAPRVDHLMSNLKIKASDLDELWAEFPSHRSPKKAACNWLKRHMNDTGPEAWLTWIAPPEACSASHYTYQYSSCDPISGTLTVTYSWLQPKACQGGLPLPPLGTLSCNYLTLENAQYRSLFAISIILLLFPLFYLIFTILLFRYGLLTTNSILALRAIQVARKLNQTRQEEKELASAGDEENQQWASHSHDTRSSSSLEISASGNSQSQTGSTTQNSSKESALSNVSPSLLKLFEIVLSMPIAISFGQFYSVFALGCCCLLSFVWINSSVRSSPSREIDFALTDAPSSLTNSICWLRYSSILSGLSLMSFALTAAALKIKQSSSKLLLAQFERRLWVFFVIHMSTIWILIGAFGASTDLLKVRQMELDSGAVFRYAACDTTPPSFLLSIASVNLVSAIYSTYSLVQLYFSPRIKQFLLNYYSNRSPAVPRTVPARPACQSTLRTLEPQALSVLFAHVFLASFGFPMALRLRMSSTTDSGHNEAIILGSAFIVMLIPVLHLILLTPSIINWLRRRCTERPRRSSSVSAALSVQHLTKVPGVKSSVPRVDTADDKNLFSMSHINGSVHHTPPPQQGGSNTLLHSLGGILSDPIALCFFEQFTDSVLDSEHLHFLLECRDIFQQLKSPRLTSQQLIYQLDHLENEYVVEGAPQQINVSANLRQTTLLAIKRLKRDYDIAETKATAAKLLGVAKPSNTPSSSSPIAPLSYRLIVRSLLVAPIKEAYNLIEMDSWVQFLKSPQAQRCSEVLLWSELFHELSEREMKSVMIHFQQMQAKMYQPNSSNETNENSQPEVQRTDALLNWASAQLVKESKPPERVPLTTGQSITNSDNARRRSLGGMASPSLVMMTGGSDSNGRSPSPLPTSASTPATLAVPGTNAPIESPLSS